MTKKIKKAFTFFLSFLLLNATLLAQSVKTNLKQGISNYYKVDDGGRWIIGERIVMNLNGQDVKGYYGNAAQGIDEYYFEGKLKGNVITGTKYELYNGTTTSIITMNVLQKSISMVSRFGKVSIPLDNQDLFKDKVFTIYETPDFNATSIKIDYDLSDKGFSILEIGKMERDLTNPGYFNIWYKIKNNEMEGWVFGLVSVF